LFNAFSFKNEPHATLQAEPAPVRLVRTFELEGMNPAQPAGLVYLPEQNTFQLMEAPLPADSSPALQPEIAERARAGLAGPNRPAGLERIAAALEDPSNLAFDPSSGYLHVLERADLLLYEMGLNGQVQAVRDLSNFGIEDPQGMTFAPSGDQTDDPEALSLYLADSGPASTGSAGQIFEISFAKAALVPASAYIAGLVQTIEAWQWSPASPDSSGMTYLPASNSLLVSDGEVEETAVFAGDNLFQATLDGDLTGSFSTLAYSSEPTGVSVNPANAHLFISDDDALKIFELNPGPDGDYATGDDTVSAFLTSAFGSQDPEGLTFDPSGALFISDGLNNEVYRVRPGANAVFDGVPPVGDDQVSAFDTAVLGLYDPEGIVYNPDLDHLYVVGRPENRLFEVTTSGALIQVIDISAANAVKPAGLAYAPGSQNPGAWNIYIADRGVDNDNDPQENDGKLYEMTLPPPPSGNVPPEAMVDSASTFISTPVIINVAANDGDPNGSLDLASINAACDNGSSGCTNPANGSLVSHPDGSFTYTPDKFFTGNDFFVYEICDTGGLCDTSMASISVYGRQTLYLSTSRGGTVGGVAFSNEDILAYSTATGEWSMFFDGSDVGLHTSGGEIDAVHLEPEGSVLLSLEASRSLPGAGNVDEWDIVRFIPTRTGDTTAGSFELYFDGEDVGLSTSEEDIDGLDFTPDGRLVISTRGSYSAGGISGGDEDLLIFTPTSLGNTTRGEWEMYFDGSDVELGASSEDISGVWIGDDGDIYLSTLGAFSVTGASGDGSDIFTCQPVSTGVLTRCNYSSYWDGLAHEFEGLKIDGIFIQTEASLDVSLKDAVDPVRAGQAAIYKATIKNLGLEKALNVVLIDTLPDSVNFASANTSQGACTHAGGEVTCDLHEIDSGESVEVTITVLTTTKGVITNEVTVGWENEDQDLSVSKTSEITTVSHNHMYLPAVHGR
jgi:uncharacterized repeat protein (TIGR01451 family)